jgi:hypothetical protein
MIRRLPIVAAWLLVGHMALGALYWALLNVPESSAWMLALSLLLVAGILAGASGLYAGALLAWDPVRSVWRSLPSGFGRSYWAIPALLLFVVFCWLSVRAQSWHLSGRGAIDATLMLRFGWADTSLLHDVIGYALLAVSWVIGLALALGVFAAGVADGVAGVTTLRWVRRSLDPRTLLIIAVTELVFVILPWRHVYWRPHGLSINGEAAFVSVKLAILAALAALAAALIGWTIVRALRGWRLAPRQQP